jgi:hypothetical protein
MGLFILVAQVRAATSFPPPENSLPASERFSTWLRDHHSPDGSYSADAQDLAAGMELARARAREMRGLMESDPAQFARRALPEAERTQLPQQFQMLVERRLKGRGSFGVYCGLPQAEEQKEGHGSGMTREVRLNGVRYRAFTYDNWKDQKTVIEATIEGVVLEDAIVLGDSPTPREQLGSGQQIMEYSPTTTGPNTLLYIIAKFSDQTNDPITEATAIAQMTVVSNFFLNNSSGVVSLRGVKNPNQVMDVVHIVLPQPSSYGATYNNNFGQLISDARTAASALGYNYANYNLDVVVTSNSGFSYAGRSYVGGQGCHLVQGYTSLRTAGHELGHNFGLWHANYWRTDSTQPFGKDSVPGGYVSDLSGGEWVEYGHYFSLMSAQYGSESDDATKPHFAPVEKGALGWLSGSGLQYVAGSGTFRLFRHDARATAGNPRGIRIETAATDYSGYGRRYWLSYRYSPWNTALNWLRNGMQIDVAQTGYGSDGAVQLDMTPYSKDQSSPFYNPASPPGGWWTIDNSDKMDGALVLGRTYDDTAAGIHITPIATGSNGTNEEYIDVVIKLGAFPGNRPPVVSTFSVTTNRVGINQAVSFTLSANDADGDTLAYAWDFDEVQVWTTAGLNSPVAAKSWSTPGQYRVMATVSDMKGGIATASQIISVGAPASTNQIWGRVLWAGQPVFGARVWTTAGSTVYQTWTETDGSYVLTDLVGTNGYTINCGKSGLTFAPQFTNPISLVSGNCYGADFFANESLPGGGSSSFVISGQVTDPVNGASGVEVRAGGMVATTDSSGNYRLTNLLNGTYTVTPANGAWTFSPVSRSVTISSANSTGNNFARVATCSISGSITGIPAGSQNPAPTVYLSNGRSVVATKAGSGGNRYWAYSINSVPAGRYSVSAELTGYSITPSGFANPLSVSGSASSVNFTGLANSSISGAISGRALSYGVPLVGVSVSAMQGSSTVASIQTDSDGYYRMGNLPSGSYTVSAAKTGYSLSPATISVASVPSSGNNFTASSATVPPTISAMTASPAVVPGPSATTVLAATATGSAPLTYSWSATVSAGPVTFSANDSTSASATTASFQVPGVYTFRCQVTDGNGLAAVKTVNVTVSAGAGTLAVSPYEVEVPAGRTVAFRADAWDQLGNRITVSPSWSAAGGGSINSTGLFSATITGGPYAVVATGSGLSATGVVWVTAGTATTNNAPALTAISNRVIHAGTMLVVTNRATDPDAPPQVLTFSLAPGAPANASIGATNGIFTWPSPAGPVNWTNSVTVRVSDNGTPVMTDAKTFTIAVIAPPVLGGITATNGTVRLTWTAIPGVAYRVQSSAGPVSGWQAATPDVVAGSSTAALTLPIVESQRFYRVLVLQ